MTSQFFFVSIAKQIITTLDNCSDEDCRREVVNLFTTYRSNKPAEEVNLSGALFFLEELRGL